jgi:hypothetical protein
MLQSFGNGMKVAHAIVQHGNTCTKICHRKISLFR